MLAFALPVEVGYQIILLQTHGSCFHLTTLRGCLTIEVWSLEKMSLRRNRIQTNIQTDTRTIGNWLPAIDFDTRVFDSFNAPCLSLHTTLIWENRDMAVITAVVWIIHFEPKASARQYTLLGYNPLCCLILPFLLYLNYNAHFQYWSILLLQNMFKSSESSLASLCPLYPSHTPKDFVWAKCLSPT